MVTRVDCQGNADCLKNSERCQLHGMTLAVFAAFSGDSCPQRGSYKHDPLNYEYNLHRFRELCTMSKTITHTHCGRPCLPTEACNPYHQGGSVKNKYPGGGDEGEVPE